MVADSELQLLKRRVQALERTLGVFIGLSILMFFRVVWLLNLGSETPDSPATNHLKVDRIEAREILIVEDSEVLARLGYDIFPRRELPNFESEVFGLYLYGSDQEYKSFLTAQGPYGSELILQDNLSQAIEINTGGKTGASSLRLSNPNSFMHLLLLQDGKQESKDGISSIAMGHGSDYRGRAKDRASFGLYSKPDPETGSTKLEVEASISRQSGNLWSFERTFDVEE